jgi:NAD-dependent SIR2 family protein deacetylase
MTNGGGFAKARCVYCREEVQVPDRYAHGDHIKCGSCGTKHKVVRGDRSRLVLADVAPVREALSQNDTLIARLESEIAQARFSFGIGANGIAIGVAYAVYEVVANQTPVYAALLWKAAGIAIGCAVLLEAASWAFFAKRQRIARLTRELEEARSEGGRIRALLRDAAKV